MAPSRVYMTYRMSDSGRCWSRPVCKGCRPPRWPPALSPPPCSCWRWCWPGCWAITRVAIRWSPGAADGRPPATFARLWAGRGRLNAGTCAGHARRPGSAVDTPVNQPVDRAGGARAGGGGAAVPGGAPGRTASAYTAGPPHNITRTVVAYVVPGAVGTTFSGVVPRQLPGAPLAPNSCPGPVGSGRSGRSPTRRHGPQPSPAPSW